MVLDDFFSETKQGDPRVRRKLESRPLDAQLASPIDRLAAQIADLVVFLPVLALVLSPFSRRAKEAQALGLDDTWTWIVLSGASAGWVTLVLYQTLFVSVYGGTPGKLALRLRVVGVWGNARPRPIEALIRALVWSVEALLLGAPFLSVFSNLKRRPFHDRASDTIVISLNRRRQVGLSTLPEISIASGFQSAVLAAVTLTLGLHLFEYHSRSESSDQAKQALQAMISNREDDGRLCPEVREALMESSNALDKKQSILSHRLETVLTLFVTGAVGQDCLDGEAELAFWRNRDLPLANLTKGLALNQKAPERATTYFNRACELDRSAGKTDDTPRIHDICTAVALLRLAVGRSTSVETGAETGDAVEDKVALIELEAQIEAALTSVTVASPDYLKAAVIRTLIQDDVSADGLTERMQQVLLLSDGTRVPQRAGAFLAQSRVKALWRLGRQTEALVALHTVQNLIDLNSRVELARWTCDAATETGLCDEPSLRACGELASTIALKSPGTERWLKSSPVAVAFVRGVACLQGRAKDHELADYHSLIDEIPFEDGKSYLEALALLKEHNERGAREKLQNLVEGSDSLASPFLREARLKLVDLATSKAELSDHIAAWRELTPGDPSFRALGRHLFTRLAHLHETSEALSIGLRLTTVESGDRSFFAAMASLARGVGQTRLATTMRLRAAEGAQTSAATQLNTVSELPRSMDRKPASEDAKGFSANRGAK